MKKNLKLFAIMLVVSMFFMGSASASDLTSKITADDGLGGLTTFTKSYDAENDVNNLKVSLVVNEDSINKILNQKPGPGAQLSTFYIGISPNTGNVPVYKQNHYYNHTDTKTIDQIKADVLGRIKENDLSDTETVWPIGVGILYYDSASSKWVKSDTAGNGVTTCRQDLMDKLGLTDSSELKYGVNFRFFMYNNLDWWMVWSDKNPATETPTKVEYIKVSYEILFPIKSSNGKESVFHTSLKDAIENGHDEITINEDTRVTEDLTIPEGKTLIIPEGVTLYIADDVNIDGDIQKNGTILLGNNELFFVNVLDTSNGTVTVTKNFALEGEEVSITVTPDKGYELKTLKVVDLSTGKEIEVKNNKFTMSNSDVEISATFVEKTETKNPKTSDINLPAMIGLILTALLGATFALRKRLSKVNK